MLQSPADFSRLNQIKRAKNPALILLCILKYCVVAPMIIWQLPLWTTYVLASIIYADLMVSIAGFFGMKIYSMSLDTDVELAKSIYFIQEGYVNNAILNTHRAIMFALLYVFFPPFVYIAFGINSIITMSNRIKLRECSVKSLDLLKKMKVPME